MKDKTELAAITAEVVEKVNLITPGVKKVGTILFLWGTSYSLQDIASIVSILAGTVGTVYSLCLLTKWWWDNFWKDIFQKARSK